MGITLPNVGLPSADLATIIEGVARWLLVVFGFIAIISFLISGIMYFLGGSMTGEKKDVSGAKKQMVWSIIGVIVGLMGLVIIQAIDRILRGGGWF